MADSKQKAKETIESFRKSGTPLPASYYKANPEAAGALKELTHEDQVKAGVAPGRNAFDDAMEEQKRRQGGVGGKYIGSPEDKHAGNVNQTSQTGSAPTHNGGNF